GPRAGLGGRDYELVRRTARVGAREHEPFALGHDAPPFTVDRMLRLGWRFREPDELRVRMRQGGASVAPFVQEGVQVAGRLGLAPPGPRFSDARQLVFGQLSDRPRVARRLHDDLLPLERRIEVRHDTNAPGVADAQCLRWGA